MNQIAGAVFDFDHIAEMINRVSDICHESYGIVMTSEGRLELVEKVLLHYHEHVNTYGVSVSGTDPYKFLAWSGIQIYTDMKDVDREIAIKFLSSAIAAMNRSLLEEKKEFPEWYLRKILKMVISEFNGKCHLGLGKNGLYLAFKSASIV